MAELTGLTHWGPFVAEVEGGRLIRTRPLPGSGASERMISALPEALYSPLRISQPMVRRGWLHKREASDRTARGTDDYLPLSWDTVTRLIADDSRRVRELHGNNAVFGGSYGWSSAGRFHHARTQVRRFLGAAGGFTDQSGNYSWGAAQFILPHILGNHAAVSSDATSWKSVSEHADLVVAFGGLNPKNWHVVSGGGGDYHLPERTRQARANGVRFVSVSPLRSDTPDWLEADWIAPRPNTDTALMLGIAHHLFRTDRHDTSFLERYCTGWPTFRDYLTGLPDGIEKSPDWAAAICGVTTEQITGLAESMTAGRTMLTASWSLQRADHGEQTYWALIALACMLGQIGMPGGGFSFGYGSLNGVGSDRRKGVMPSMPMTPNPAGPAIPVARISDALLHPGEEISFNGKQIRYPDIRMVQWAGGNPFHHHQDLRRLERAWAKPETIIVQDSWWTPAAKRADIVLPATTALERRDIGGTSRDLHIFAMQQIVAPIGQARNDVDMLADLAEALDCRDTFTDGLDSEEWLDRLYEMMAENGRRQGLTPPDKATFWQQGGWTLPPPESDEVMLSDFRQSPDRHPLKTPSGRIEITSPAIAAFGYSDCPAHPAWLEPAEWLGGAAEGELHLLTHQPRYRLHSQLGQTRGGKSEQIDGRETVMISPADAGARGITGGEAVRLFNDRGACLATAVVTGDIRDGVVIMQTGSWYEPDSSGSLDLHGNPNILTRDVGASQLSQAPAAQTALVRIEKWAPA